MVDEKPTKGKSPNNWRGYVLAGALSIAGVIFTHYGANALSDINPIWGYIAFLTSSSIIISLWIWKVEGRFLRKRRFVTLIRIITIIAIVMAMWLLAPSYIDHFVRPQGTIEFPTWVNDSQQVFVHYGKRTDDFFWTETTIGELKQESKCSLNVSGQEIFTVHTDGRRLYVDALLFAGYTDQTVPNYTSIGSVTNFSIGISGYFVTNSTAVGKSFVSKTQATEVKNKALAPPVVIKNNSFDYQPPGWKVYQTNTALEVDNEHGLPMLVMKYHSPYEITITGLFLTPFGILKVDNTEDVIFEFADSPFELNVYRADRVYRPSIFDWFKPEKSYILLDKGS